MLQLARNGQPLSLAWSMFDRIVDDETQRLRAQCKACGRSMVPHAKRMAAHVDWCCKLPGTPAMEEYQRLVAELNAMDASLQPVPDDAASTSSSMRSPPSLASTPSKRAKQTTLCVVRTDESTQEHISELLCRCLVATQRTITSGSS